MLKKNPTARNCSEQEYETACSIGRQSLVTLEVPILDQWPGWWTRSLRASPASLTAWPGNSVEKQMNETSGPIPYGALARWDPSGSCWKMSQVSFLEMIDGHPMQASWSGSFPKSGTMQSGVLYPQRTQAHHPNENGGGVLPPKWPPPHARDWKGNKGTTVWKNGRFIRVSDTTGIEYGANLDGAVAKWPTPSAMPRGPHTGRDHDGLHTVSKTTGTRFGMTLETAIKHWPTPTATERTNDVTATPSQATLDRFHAGEIARVRKTRSPTLTTAVNEGQRMWPTPNTSDAKTANMKDDHDLKKGYLRGEVGGQLNPLWVTWLMGLPVGWVSLAPLSIEEYKEWLVDMTAGTWWDTERDLPRVAQSVPKRVNMLKTLGNGIVPEVVAEFLKETEIPG